MTNCMSGNDAIFPNMVITTQDARHNSYMNELKMAAIYQRTLKKGFNIDRLQLPILPQQQGYEVKIIK